MLVAAPFTGRVRDILLGFKYRNRRAIAGHLAGLLVNRVARAGQRVDVVTWAPTSLRRRHQRGFDQAELVARQVARQLGVPCRRLLDRAGGAPAQTGQARAARLGGPAFRAHPGYRRRGSSSSTTWSRRVPPCTPPSAALRAAGATDVVLAAVAATPAQAASGPGGVA